MEIQHKYNPYNMEGGTAGAPETGKWPGQGARRPQEALPQVRASQPAPRLPSELPSPSLPEGAAHPTPLRPAGLALPGPHSRRGSDDS